MYVQLAWRNLWRNKKRTLITISSIFFAVLLALFMRSMQLGSYSNMIDKSVRLFSGHAQIQAHGYWDDKTLENSFEYTAEIRQVAEQAPHTEVFVPRLESFALASSGNLTKGTMMVGIDPAREDEMTGLIDKVTVGEYLTDDDQAILIGKGLAEYLKVSVGDTVVFISQGYHGQSAASKYPVKGILKFPIPDLNEGSVYFPLKEAQWFYSAPNRLTSISFLLDNHKMLPELMGYLSANTGKTYEIKEWREILDVLVQTIAMDNAQGIIMLGILYMIIGFGILGTMIMMTAERRYEFAVLVAIGMQRKHLAFVVAIESLFLTIIGVIAGMIVGLPILMVMHKHPIPITGEAAKAIEQWGWEPIMPFSLDPAIFITQGEVVLILSILAILYPIWIINKFRVIHSLRG